MDKPVLMLSNPAAGRTISTTALGTAVSAFCEAGYSPNVYFTKGPGTASGIVAELGRKYEVIVCLGGDGTLSDVIQGLMKIPKKQRPLIGYIPMGTANDVATTLGLPHRRPGRAVGRILKGEPLEYDVGEMVHVGMFSYIAAFGAFTEVSYKTDQEMKHAFGQAAYILEGINAIANIKSYRAKVEYDDGALEGEFLYGALSNSLSVAGMMKLNKKLVNLSDGKFELLLVHKKPSMLELNSIFYGLLNQDYSVEGLTVLQTSRAKFTFEEPVPWTRDGEDGGKHKELELQCHPRAVKILC